MYFDRVEYRKLRKSGALQKSPKIHSGFHKVATTRLCGPNWIGMQTDYNIRLSWTGHKLDAGWQGRLVYYCCHSTLLATR